MKNPNSIKRIQLGVTACYLIACQDGGYVLVDAGEPGLGSKFKRQITRWRINPGDIRLIIITHAHYDHVGSLAAIKEWCQCPVMMHPQEAEILKQARVVIPPGTTRLGRIFSRIGSTLKPFMKFPPAKADILVDHQCNLRAFGLAGEVVPTPGHTSGSLSVVLETGDALVGDLAMNYLFNSTFPIFADNLQCLITSRQWLKDRGVRRIYPAHGRPFPISQL